MKKTILLAGIFCLFAISAFAQNKTDYSGEWSLDKAKSTLDDRMRGVESMTMTVAQTEKELKVETTTKRAAQADGGMNRGGGMMGGGGPQTLVYSLDGKETKAETGSGTMAGTATLKASVESDGKLKLSSVREMTTQMGAMTITTKETWELTDGGKTLKVTREMETPRGTNSSELVFTKKDSVKIDAAAAVSASTSSMPTPKVISGGVVNGKAINLVKPEYPEAAKAVRASGAVNVQVTIDEEGNVISASAVSGHPLLRAASEAAARASKFKPTLLEGVPVKVTGVVIYNFVAP
jgi:TonB family protein